MMRLFGSSTMLGHGMWLVRYAFGWMVIPAPTWRSCSSSVIIISGHFGNVVFVSSLYPSFFLLTVWCTIGSDRREAVLIFVMRYILYLWSCRHDARCLSQEDKRRMVKEVMSVHHDPTPRISKQLCVSVTVWADPARSQVAARSIYLGGLCPRYWPINARSHIHN